MLRRKIVFDLIYPKIDCFHVAQNYIIFQGKYSLDDQTLVGTSSFKIMPLEESF